MSLSQTTVAKLYASVIEDVIGGVREYFVDEGIDEQVLMELKASWEKRLQETRAVEVKADVDPQPPPLLKQPQNIAAKTALSNHLTQNTGAQQPTVPLEFGNKNVSIQITLPAQQGVPGAQPRSITIQVPATALQGNQLQSVLTGPVISATMSLPQHLATALLQQHVTAALQGHATTGVIQMPVTTATALQQQQQQQQQNNDSSTTNRQGFRTQTTQETSVQSAGGAGVTQLDGPNDTSDEDEDDDDDDDEDDNEEDDDEGDDKEDEENDDLDGGPEEEPLNSGDDVSEEDPSDMFETDNVVVCQYDKITRTRNKWKFYLKDGIMNLGGKDYIFQKSNGDAEW